MIADIDEIKVFLGISHSNLDSLFNQAIKKADAKLVNLINQNVEETSTEIGFFGSLADLHIIGDRYYYNLKNFPIKQIDSIKYRSFGSSDVTLDSSKYELVEDKFFRVVFSEPLNNSYFYTIAYTYGYTADKIPEDLKHLANFYAIDYIYKSKAENDFKRFGLDSKVISNEFGSFTEKYVSEPKQLETRIMNKYGVWI